jgi:hypothetical protein
MDSIRGLLSREEQNDFWVEDLDLTDSILTLFTAFIDFEFLSGDLEFSKFVMNCFVPLFEAQDCETMVCGHLRSLIPQVADEALLGIAEPLRHFLDRLLERPSCIVCELSVAIASRDADVYCEYLIETGVIRLFANLSVTLEEMEALAANLLRNFAACEAEGPINFLFESEVVRFIGAVFDGGSFRAQHDCLFAVMLLVRRGLVAPVLATFAPAFVCLPDVLEAGKRAFCAEVANAFGILLNAIDGAPPDAMAELRAIVASAAIIRAFTTIAADCPLACDILGRLELLAD